MHCLQYRFERRGLSTELTRARKRAEDRMRTDSARWGKTRGAKQSSCRAAITTNPSDRQKPPFRVESGHVPCRQLRDDALRPSSLRRRLTLLCRPTPLFPEYGRPGWRREGTHYLGELAILAALSPRAAVNSSAR